AGLVALPKLRGGVRPIAVGEVVSQAVAHFPGLARWVSWTYRRPTALQFGAATTVHSAGGVQQGDPLGPLLFSAVLQSLATELRALPLDLAFFYLDDGVLAGDVQEVVRALQHVQRRATELGLQLNLSKCEVVGAGLLSESALTRVLPQSLLYTSDGSSRFQRNFELLGAAIGDEDFTASHCLARAQAAAPLLEAIGGLEDSQVSLRLLRSCAGHARLVHSMRSYKACCELDASYGLAPLSGDPYVVQALAAFNDFLPQPLAADVVLASKQKMLTTAEASWQRHLATSSLTARAVLRSEAEPGARAFLAAVPSGPTRMESAAFIVELRQRFGAPDAASDTWCPLCQGVLDTHSLHASTCAAGGERTQRHHALRDALCNWAARAGLQPERERPGLLLPQRPEEARVAARRPADIYLPSFQGSPVALDLAVVAPQRQESLAQAGQVALAAASSYTHTKETHLDTARLCSAQGVRFRPLVAEATGAWTRDASTVLLAVSKAVAVRTNQEASLLHAQLLQELSVISRGHRARAVLRRRAEASEHT
ncbi:unnamed protein product, partial [Symbiodinium necroappetens]